MLNRMDICCHTQREYVVKEYVYYITLEKTNTGNRNDQRGTGFLSILFF